MKTKPITICLALIALLFAACQKNDVYPDTILGKKINPGDGGGPSLPSGSSYFPVTKGSSWTYEGTILGQVYTAKYYMTGAQSVFNGKTYHEVGATINFPGATAETGYYYSSPHLYALREKAETANAWIDIPILVDTVSVGNTWHAAINETGSVNSVPGRFVGTMVERNISYTILGKTYTNVMHTSVDCQYNFGNGFESTMIYDIYLGKGIGLLQLSTTALGIPATTMKIKSFTVK